MSARWSLLGMALLCAVGLAFSCRFEPDLSRFEACAEDDSCALGYTCLSEARRCLPDCGEQGPCPTDPPPDPSGDAGMDEDGGTDAGDDAGDDGGTDAGVDAGTDAGPPLSWETKSLALAIEKLPYTDELRAQGGTPPYAFQATEPLPEWLTLDGGILSGTPPQAGTYRVAVEVSDGDSPPARKSTAFNLRARTQLRVAGPEILVDGYQNNSYSETVSATGGSLSYELKVVSGDLPPGLALLPSGSVAGTPSATGTYTFQVQATDSDPEQPQKVVRQLTLAITSSPLLLSFSSEAVPDGRVGTPYQYALRYAPSANVTWKLKAGAVPPGIGFSASTGTLSGTPNVAGSYTFTINITDGLLGNADRSFTLTVY